MPITLPAGTESELAKKTGSALRLLVDIQTADGTTYFLSDWGSSYPGRIITPGNQVYLPWVKSAGHFTQSKDGSTDGGDLVLQNLSGNTIDRDVSQALAAHEFEGALCVVRVWHPLLQSAIKEFHFTLSEATPKDDEASIRALNLSDFSRLQVADLVVQPKCSWVFKSKQCGSTGTATSCLKRLKEDCQDASRAAQERFNGVLVTLSSLLTPPTVNPGDGGGSGDRGDGGGIILPPGLIRPPLQG